MKKCTLCGKYGFRRLVPIQFKDEMNAVFMEIHGHTRCIEGLNAFFAKFMALQEHFASQKRRTQTVQQTTEDMLGKLLSLTWSPSKFGN